MFETWKDWLKFIVLGLFQLGTPLLAVYLYNVDINFFYAFISMIIAMLGLSTFKEGFPMRAWGFSGNSKIISISFLVMGIVLSILILLRAFAIL